MEADKLGRLYCKGWRQMIEDKVVADISSWVRQTKYIRKKKMLKTKTRKESVTEELRTRNEGSSRRLAIGGQRVVTAIPATSLRENKQKNL
jgi:hypothetical protein